MANYLDQLNRIREKHNNVPGVIAGDLFHRWNSPPELINFAISRLAGWRTIPGQHDLPYHRYEDIRKSAYWTLVEAGSISHLSHKITHRLGDLFIKAFPWGFTPQPFDGSDHRLMRVAIVHQYVWKKDCAYPNASPEQHADKLTNQLEGFDVAFFGDNHKGFIQLNSANKCTIVNCGGFIRRNSDETDYVPCVSLLYSDGTVRRQPLDTSKDKLISNFKPDTREINTKTFLEAIKGMDIEDMNFKEYLLRLVTHEGRLSKSVRSIISTMLEEIK